MNAWKVPELLFHHLGWSNTVCVSADMYNAVNFVLETALFLNFFLTFDLICLNDRFKKL